MPSWTKNAWRCCLNSGRDDEGAGRLVTYEKDYEKRWNDSAVMYNKYTGRIITAPHEEEVGPAIGSGSAPASGRRLDLKPEKMGKEMICWCGVWREQDNVAAEEAFDRRTGRCGDDAARSGKTR